MDGTWNLEVATPFGKHPATLIFERAGDGNALTAHITSQVGVINLRDLNETADGFNANASYDFKGTTYTAKVTGTADGDRLDGTIKISLAIAPTIRYTGTRAP